MPVPSIFECRIDAAFCQAFPITLMFLLSYDAVLSYGQNKKEQLTLANCSGPEGKYFGEAGAFPAEALRGIWLVERLVHQGIQLRTSLRDFLFAAMNISIHGNPDIPVSGDDLQRFGVDPRGIQ